MLQSERASSLGDTTDDAARRSVRQNGALLIGHAIPLKRLLSCKAGFRLQIVERQILIDTCREADGPHLGTKI